MTVIIDLLIAIYITLLFDNCIASQMWLLAQSLPLLIGSFVPEDDEYWGNFCKFLRIVQHLFAPSLTEDDLAVL